MSRYFAHPLSHMVKVPDSMTWEELAVTEPLVIALHALHSLKLKKGEHIVIIGAGAIGMLGRNGGAGLRRYTDNGRYRGSASGACKDFWNQIYGKSADRRCTGLY
ncbi:MAG: hypothetical protein ACLUOI_35810 [Eisenbergiella sp.]